MNIDVLRGEVAQNKEMMKSFSRELDQMAKIIENIKGEVDLTKKDLTDKYSSLDVRLQMIEG